MRTIQRAVVFATALALTLPCLAQEPQTGDPFQAQLKLCEAITAGDVKAAAAALDAGAKLTQLCPKEMIPPLHQAVEVGSVEVVTLLLDRGADVNQPDNGVSATPLHYAAAKENPALVALLLKRGAKVDTLTDEGLSALAFSVLSHDNAAVVQALIDAGADVNAVDEQGDTLLDTALSLGRKEIVVLLEAKGAKKGEEPGMSPEAAAPAEATPTPLGRRTAGGMPLIKGLYLGMPLMEAINIFRRVGREPYLYEGDKRNPTPEDPAFPRPDANGVRHLPDGSLYSSCEYFYLNYWVLEAHSDGRVKKIMMESTVVNQLFESGGISDQEFFNGFLEAYGLREKAQVVQVKVKSPLRFPEKFMPDTCEAFEYVDPSGWYVNLNQFRDLVYAEAESRPKANFD
jgi:hypothetical protein